MNGTTAVALIPIAWLLHLVPAWAQSAPTPTQQRGGTYVDPPAKVDPVYVPLGPNQPGEAPWQEPRVTLRFTLDGNLRDPRFSLNEDLATRIANGFAKALGVNAEGLAKGAGETATGLGNALKNLLGP